MNGLILPQNFICGYFDCSIFGDLKQSPLRQRTLFEIEYFLEDGRVTYSDGVAYPIKKGHIRIGSPGEYSYSILPFKTKYVKFSADGELAARLNALPRYFKSHRPFETEKMLDEIISLYNTPDTDELKLSGLLLLFLSAVTEDAGAVSTSPSREAVQRARGFIETNATRQIKLSDIARAVNLSPNYLHTLYLEVEGITPHAHITECRLRAVTELLRTTSLPLSDIAEKCGFCNQQYMSSLFKKRFGLSPSAYRREVSREYLV